MGEELVDQLLVVSPGDSEDVVWKGCIDLSGDSRWRFVSSLLTNLALFKLVSRLLTNWRRRIQLVEIPDVSQVRDREAARVRILAAKVGGKTLNELAAPRLILLAAADVGAEPPVEAKHLDIDRQRSLDLRTTVVAGHSGNP